MGSARAGESMGDGHMSGQDNALEATRTAAEGEPPLVTIALLAYNQERYISDALVAVLAQDYENLEIIISDDASTDTTWSVVQSVVADYQGRHRIRLNRNPGNLGIGAHVSHVFGLASGELVVMAAGDDVSQPERVRILLETWLEAGADCKAVCSDCLVIDSDGREGEVLQGRHFEGDLRVGVACFFDGLLGCTAAWARVLYTEFGSMLPGSVCEDRILPLRCALLGKIAYVQKPLVKYRVHGANISHFFDTDEDMIIATTARIHARNQNIAENYLADFDFAITRGMVDAKAVASAYSVAKKMKDEFRHKHAFLSGNTRDRIGLIVRAMFRQPFQALKWLYILVLPRYYRSHQAKNLRVP